MKKRRLEDARRAHERQERPKETTVTHTHTPVRLHQISLLQQHELYDEVPHNAACGREAHCGIAVALQSLKLPLSQAQQTDGDISGTVAEVLSSDSCATIC